MTVKSLNDAFSGDTDLRHGAGCDCGPCSAGKAKHTHGHSHTPLSSEEMMEKAVENAIVKSVFGHNDISRRSFMGLVGGATAVRCALIGVPYG
jgi:nitrate/nitrite transport system substrate-binding protein